MSGGWTGHRFCPRCDGSFIDLSLRGSFLRTVVAFANTAGGLVVIGVEDRTANVRGVEEALDMEERVASIISDAIQPRILPEIDILNFRDRQLLGVRIHPSTSRPTAPGPCRI